MKNFKIHYFICILFLSYSINLLIEDYSSINYVIVEEQDLLFSNSINFIICIKFDQIKENDRLFLKLNQQLYNKLKLTNVSVYNFLNYSISSIELNLNDKSPFSITNSSIIKDFVCFKISHFDLGNSPFIEKLVQNYYIRLYAYSDGKIPYYYDYIYYKYEYIKKMIYLKIGNQRIFGENYLKLQSKCLTKNDQIKQTRFICLNHCFKEYRMGFAKYDHNDLIKFNLSLISNGLEEIGKENTKLSFSSVIRKVKLMNETGWKMVEEYDELNFKKCISKCKELDCFYEAFDTVRVRDEYYEKNLKDENKISISTTTFRAHYSMTIKDFLGQLFGLITLFSNTSIINTLPLIVYLIARNLKKHNKFYFKLILNSGTLRKRDHLFFKLIFFKFQHFLISISLVYLIYESLKMIQLYNHKLIYPNQTINLDFERKNLNIVLCFPIELIIFNDSIIEKGRNENLLNNFTINQIIDMTNDIKNKLIKSVLINTFEATEVEWRTTNELLFKNEIFNNSNLLCRCFNIKYDEPLKMKYKSIIPIKYLVVYLLGIQGLRSVYFFEKDQNFSSNMIDLKGEFLMGKMKIINSEYSKKSNCKNYENYENFKCKKRRVCLDLCINKKYFDIYKNVSIINSVIDFNILNLSLNHYFTSHYDNKIIEECLSIFERRDCTEAYYFETLKTSYNSIPDIITVNLNYEKTTIRELDNQSLVKVIFDIINLEIIFFSTNALGILSFIILLIKKKFKMIKIPKLIKIMICLIGFLIHNFFIFNSLLNEKLIENTYFTKINPKGEFSLPNIIFCIYDRLNSKRDDNVKFTRKYLDQLSIINNYDEIFSIISYFNRTHQNFYYNFNQTNPEIEITHFYYLKGTV